MKLNLSIAAIFILFGLIYLALNKNSPVTRPESQNKIENKSQEIISNEQILQEKVKENIKIPELDQSAIELIQAVAALSLDELNTELSTLRERLNQDNLFNKLEQGLLDDQKKAE